MDHPPFPGFRDEAFAFLRELEANNRRDWFKPRKDTYEDEVVWPLRCLLLDAAREAAARGLPLDAALLRAWRLRMTADPDAFLALADQLVAHGLPLRADGDQLKRMPRGFEDYADTDLADYLRWKTFVTVRPVSDDELRSPAFTGTLVATMEAVLPLLSYGWEAERTAAASGG